MNLLVVSDIAAAGIHPIVGDVAEIDLATLPPELTHVFHAAARIGPDAASDWAAMSPVEAKKLQLETENQLAGLQAELAAFDAGLLPMQPAAPAGSEAAERRRDYRSFLERRVEFATNLWKLTLQQVGVGVASQRQLAETLMTIARAKKDLAAFDAGLAPPPARPAQ